MWPLDYSQRLMWDIINFIWLVNTFSQQSVSAQITLEFTLTEECPLHTFVGNLNGAPMGTISNPYPLNTFQLLTQTNQFVLNETTGDLFTRSRIDRERLCPQQPQQPAALDSPNRLELDKLNFPSSAPNDLSGPVAETVCRLQLQALQFTQKSPSDQEPMTHRVILIKVIILDVNDNAPGWSESVIHLSVPEHSPIGTRLPLPTAFDPDCGPINTTTSYVLRDLTKDDRVPHGAINPYGHEAFQLDTEFVPGANSVELSHSNLPNLWLVGSCSRRVFRLWLRVVRDLEYDNTEMAMSAGRQQHQNLPRMDGSFSTTSLYLRSARLQLVAADGGQPTALTGHILINITVTDTNDHPPIFQLSSLTQPMKDFSVTQSGAVSRQDQLELDENTPIGRVIYVARASDIDDVDNGHLQYKLGTSASLLVRKMFEVNAKTGEIVLLQSPDFERQRLYTVPVSVTDGKHVTSLNLIVRINNQNDHPPVITIRPVGQPKDEHSSKAGIIPLHSSLSQSTSSQFPHAKSITLYVTEHDAPGRFIATVTVTDIDEVTGTEDALDFTGESSLNADYGSAGMRNTGDSAIMGTNCKLSHAGLALQPLFEGSLNQFKLVTRASFDREQQTDQFATLTCYDRGHPPLSTQIGIHLVIEDINDHGPTFKHSPMTAHLKENEPIGTKVYTVEAHDPDVGANAQLGYSLDESNTNDFTIDSRSGVISSLRSFDREKREYFNLTVIVRDQVNKYHESNSLQSQLNTRQISKTDGKHGPEHKVIGHVIVYIKDVNDCPPLFPNSLYQLSVSEDAKINFLIGQINASDADATEANSQIHYVIQQQADNQAMQEFRVSPKGYIYVARGNLDREKVSSYNFHLIAIDSGVPPLSSTTQVHIYITDVNDNAPTWQFPAHNNQAINLTVSEPVGYRLGQLNAVDPDEGENGEVGYRLVQTSVITARDDHERSSMLVQKVGMESGTFGAYHPNEGNYPRPNTLSRPAAGNLFELDPSSGSIYVGRSMSLEDIGSVKLVVEARDHGKPPRVNHRVLQVNILRFLSQTDAYNANGLDDSSSVSSDKGRYRSQNATGGGHIENDLIVIVIMVAVTLIISLALIVAILFLRCGACPSRNILQYNSNGAQDYRQNVSTTHHLEEVFRDSGAIDADGLIPGTMDSMSNCNQLNDATLTTYHTNVENEPMFRSYLSTHGSTDPWLLTNVSPQKVAAQGCDTINRPCGTITRIQSPCVREENNKLINTIGPDRRIKRVDDGTLGCTSVTDSPDHEMRLLVAKRGKHSTTPCSTFRASCSHLTGARSVTPCKATGKLLMNLMKDAQIPNELEDVDSMDSGHGHSVENGTGLPCDPLSQRPKSTNQMTTFRCYTPGACSERKVAIRKFSTDLDNGDFDRLERAKRSRPRSGTLPSAFNLDDESLTEQPDRKFKMELGDTSKTLSSKSQPSHLVRARQSVTWLDPAYQTCERAHSSTETCERGDEEQQHSSTCPHYVISSELDRSTDRETLVVLNPVDRLGYAQLVHSSSGLCDQNSPVQKTYSSFPTSFV